MRRTVEYKTIAWLILVVLKIHRRIFSSNTDLLCIQTIMQHDDFTVWLSDAPEKSRHSCCPSFNDDQVPLYINKACKVKKTAQQVTYWYEYPWCAGGYKESKSIYPFEFPTALWRNFNFALQKVPHWLLNTLFSPVTTCFVVAILHV